MRFSFVFTWLVLVLCCLSEVRSAFYFAGKDSRLRITDPRAKVVLKKPMLNFQGTLETSDAIATLLTGEPIVFSAGIVERNGASAMWTGRFDPSQNGMILLDGSSQMRAQPGMVFPGMQVSGSDNLIEGTPKFSQPIHLADSNAELKFSIQNKLSHSIHLNGGKIRLEDTLSIGDDVMMLGDGVIDINSHTLNFPGKKSVWNGNLSFLSATDVTLSAVTVLNSIWYFGPDNSTAVLQGNGNMLDISGGGQIVVQNGVGLGVTDIVIKGLGVGQGSIVMWDTNSTLSLSNAVLQLTGNYSFTQGNLYFYGANSMIVTGTNVLTIGSAVATIDATTLEYDTLVFSDMHPIVPYIPNGTSLISLNGGRLMCRPSGISYGSSLYIDIPFYQQAQHMSCDGTNRILNFRGNDAANMTWDGGGYTLQFPRGTSLAGSLVVAAGKTVTLQNVVLKDFSSSAVTLGSGASLIFGDGVTIELGSYEALTMTWSFTGQTTPSKIHGNGNVLDLSTTGSLVVQNGVGLALNYVVINGLSESRGSIELWDLTSTLSVSNTILHVEGNYSFTKGNLYFYGANSMIVTGGNTLAFNGTAVVTIDGTTVEYDTLGLPDMHSIIPNAPDGIHLITANGGRLMSRPSGVSYGSSFYIDMPFYQQPKHLAFDGANHILNFRGSGASSMTWDGGGYTLQFPRGAALAGSLVVAANKTVTLQNVVLKDFSSSAVTLGSGASLIFGNGVTVELGSNESLTMTWSFTGQSTASTIRGNGKCLNLDALTGSNKVAISVGPAEGAGSPVTLNIEDVHLIGLKGVVNYDDSMTVAPEYTYSTVSAYIASANLLRCVDYTGVINLRNVDLNLAGNYTLSAGSINIYNDVALRGKGYQFAFSSNGTFAINSGATFLIDRNVTFSYDSSGLGDRSGDGVTGASKDQLTMADQTSRLFLNGCTFYGTMTSPHLQTGVLVINDRVIVQSEGDVDSNAIGLDSTNNLRIEVLAGATMDVYGALAHL